MGTSTEEMEQQALDSAEGIGKVGTQISLGVHHAVMAGGEPTRKLADFLHGTWLGHPLHPVLTDITIGAWSMGTMMDIIGGVTDSNYSRKAADQLMTIGTISAVPTALTGLADFSTFPDWSANTATWHAALNSVNLGLYIWSVAERRRGNRTRGVLISSIAFGLTCVSAWLGGKLVYRAKVGVDHSERFEEPQSWKPVMDSEDLAERDPKRVEFEGKGILLYRNRGEIYAIGSVCSHAGGPLEDGQFHGSCVQCPWHDSVFDMKDGSIIHGPATSPQPHFQTRIRNGQIEIRLSDPDDDTGE
jgi:nitrite reductase/ring-hydroxylating ferredoxin subunit/uncharacterized membrane protein